MPNLAPQVDIRDGQNVNSNNDEFQKYRHKSRENAVPRARNWPEILKIYRAQVSQEVSQWVRLKQPFGHFPAFMKIFIHFCLQSLVGLLVGFLLNALVLNLFLKIEIRMSGHESVDFMVVWRSRRASACDRNGGASVGSTCSNNR